MTTQSSAVKIFVIAVNRHSILPYLLQCVMVYSFGIKTGFGNKSQFDPLPCTWQHNTITSAFFIVVMPLAHLNYSLLLPAQADRVFNCVSVSLSVHLFRLELLNALTQKLYFWYGGTS